MSLTSFRFFYVDSHIISKVDLFLFFHSHHSAYISFFCLEISNSVLNRMLKMSLILWRNVSNFSPLIMVVAIFLVDTLYYVKFIKCLFSINWEGYMIFIFTHIIWTSFKYFLVLNFLCIFYSAWLSYIYSHTASLIC